MMRNRKGLLRVQMIFWKNNKETGNDRKKIGIFRMGWGYGAEDAVKCEAGIQVYATNQSES